MLEKINKTFYSDERITPYNLFPYEYSLFEVQEGGFIKKTTLDTGNYNFFVTKNNTIIPDHSGNEIKIYKNEDAENFKYSKEEKIPGNVIYLHNCGHYLHFIAETLASLIIYKELGVFKKYLPKDTKILVLSNVKVDFKKIELFLDLDLSKYEIIYGKKDVLYRAGKVMLNTTTTQVAGTILPHYTTKYINNKFKNKYDVVSSKCLFLSRRDACHRLLINENELIAYFKNKGIELDVIEGGSLTVEEQIKKFNTAENIITVSGTNSVGLLYVNSSVKKIIVLSPKYITGQAKQIAKCLNLKVDIVYAYEEEAVELKGKLLHQAYNNYKVDPEQVYEKFYE